MTCSTVRHFKQDVPYATGAAPSLTQDELTNGRLTLPIKQELMEMGADDLASDARKEENQKIREHAIWEAERGQKGKATTDQFQCSKCRQRKCTYYVRCSPPLLRCLPGNHSKRHASYMHLMSVKPATAVNPFVVPRGDPDTRVSSVCSKCKQDPQMRCLSVLMYASLQIVVISIKLSVV